MDDRKPKPLKRIEKPKKVSVKLDSDLKRTLPSKILSDGYNMRQKSLWVVEAIESLLSRDGWEGVLLSEIVVKPDAQDVFSIPNELMIVMNREIARVNMANPSLKPNQSTIVRAAINRRLLGFFTKQGS